jgi:hypothetical protein
MRKLIILTFLLLSSIFLFSQNYDEMPAIHTESWASTDLEIKLNKKITFNLKEEIRLKSIGIPYDRIFTQLNFEYTLFRSIDLGIGYRYINLNDEEGKLYEIENHQRIHGSLAYTLKLDRFSSKIRGQYQTRSEILSDEKLSCASCPYIFSSEHRKYWRIKNDFQYNIRNWKFDPKISFEFFLLNTQQNTFKLNKYRCSIGTNYKLRGPHEISIKYMYEKEVKKWNPVVVHIFDIQYRYILRLKKRKLKDDS